MGCCQYVLVAVLIAGHYSSPGFVFEWITRQSRYHIAVAADRARTSWHQWLSCRTLGANPHLYQPCKKPCKSIQLLQGNTVLTQSRLCTCSHNCPLGYASAMMMLRLLQIMQPYRLATASVMFAYLVTVPFLQTCTCNCSSSSVLVTMPK